MSTLHGVNGRGRFRAVKGSPLEVLALCRNQLSQGKKRPLTEEDRIQEALAGRAFRMLGLAYGRGREAEAAENGLIWLGLIAKTDPIRPGVVEAIRAFHRAGIATVMLTGDQSPTAFAIGQELDLSRGRPLEILEAVQLSQVPPETLEALVPRAPIFARVSPAHKLRIVQALQRAGKVVAMTGDGINDGPALKAADVGIAMGRTGNALSGKDLLRIDRIGSYAARYAAKNVVAAGLAEECEVVLCYSIGLARPASVQVETFGTGKLSDDRLAAIAARAFDFRPIPLLRHFQLRHLPARHHGVFYRALAAYGQVGGTDMALPWEATDRVPELEQFLP